MSCLYFSFILQNSAVVAKFDLILSILQCTNLQENDVENENEIKGYQANFYFFDKHFFISCFEVQN